MDVVSQPPKGPIFVLKRLFLVTFVLLLAIPVAAAATAEFKPEQQQLKPADVKLAKKIALRRADLGASWRAVPGGTDTSDDSDLAGCPEFDVDLSSFTITGRAASGFQNARGSTVFSSVEVFASKAQAVGDFTAVTSHPAFLGCVRSLFEQGAQSEPQPGLTFEVGDAQPLNVGRVGQQVFAFRIPVEARVDGRVPVDLFFDTIYLQKGRTTASVMFITALSPYPAEAKLARKLAARIPR